MGVGVGVFIVIAPHPKNSHNVTDFPYVSHISEMRETGRTTSHGSSTVALAVRTILGRSILASL